MAKKTTKTAPTSADQDAIGYLAALAANSVAARNHAGAANAVSSFEKKKWEGDMVVPPGTPLFDLLEAFKRHTDLPLCLSMHSFLFYLSTWLLDQETTVYCEGQTLTPELWTIVLAPSGCGKTYSLDRIRTTAPTQATIQGVKSGAAFFDALLSNEQQGRVNAMLVDEVGQLIQQIEQKGSPLADLKGYLLDAYGGNSITHNTVKGGERIVNDTTMTFLGLNVDETMWGILSPTSFLDGFCQRFAFVIAERDSERHFTDFPRYNNEQIEAVVAKAWSELTAIQPLKQYTYSPQATAEYDKKFREFGLDIERDGVVNVSFFRRLLQRAHKLALLYHIILGKAAIAEIDAVDVAWAMRLTEWHLRDISKAILAKAGKAGVVLRDVQAMAAKRAAEGRTLTARDLQQRGPQLVRASSDVARNALAAINLMDASLFDGDRDPQRDQLQSLRVQ
jgi:hypothetical protein